MKRRTLPAFALLLACLAAPAPVAAQAPAQRPAQNRGLWIGPIPACAATVAMVTVEPDLTGMLHAVVIFRPAWREALRRETTRLYSRQLLISRRMNVRLDGRIVMSPIVREPITGGVIELSPLTAREATRVRAAALRPCPARRPSTGSG